MKKKTGLGKKIGIGAGLVVGIIFLLGIIGASLSPTDSSVEDGNKSVVKESDREMTGAENGIVEVPVLDDSIKLNSVNISYYELMRNNDGYVGDIVYFQGKVIQITGDYGSDNYILLVSVIHDGYYIDSVYINYHGPRVLEGDIVDLWGEVDGLKTYEAVLGNEITIPEITTELIEVVEKVGERNLVIKTVLINETQEKRRQLIIFTLEKIEFLNDHTRAYVNIENKASKEEISFYSYNSVAFQGKNQFGTKYVYGTNLPEILSTIRPGIEDNGVIYFEPVDYELSTANFEFEVVTEYYQRYKFEFDVDIPK